MAAGVGMEKPWEVAPSRGLTFLLFGFICCFIRLIRSERKLVCLQNGTCKQFSQQNTADGQCLWIFPGGDKPLNTSTMLSDSVYSGAVLKTLRRFIILVDQEQDSDNPQYIV